MGGPAAANTEIVTLMPFDAISALGPGFMSSTPAPGGTSGLPRQERGLKLASALTLESNPILYSSYKISVFFMMNKSLNIGRIILILFAVILTACATTQLTDVWYNNDYTDGPLTSILVVGLAEDTRSREGFEQTFAAQFEKHGVKAIPSSSILKSPEALTKEALKTTAEDRGLQAVLVTHLAGIEKKEVYIPASYAPFPVYYNEFGPYYARTFEYVYHPEYRATQEFVKLETNLYLTSTEKLIWSAASESLAPDSSGDIIDTLCPLIMRNLKKSGLIP